MTVKEWVKANAKDGANFAEFDELLKSMEVPTDMTEAKAFVFKNKALLSAFDDEVRIKIEAHDAKFKESKLPELVKAEREKIMKELNPEETPEKKELRELKERFNQRESELTLEKRKAALRTKACEIGFDPVLAETFAGFGDDAESYVLKVKEYTDKALATNLEAEIKKRFAGGGQIKNGGNPAKTLLPQSEINSMQPKDRAAFFAKGGGIQEE